MQRNSFKEQVYRELSRLTHALSSPKRIELIDVLSQRQHTVEELSKEISMSVASTSQHLQVLKAAKLVETRRSGNFIIYSVSDDQVFRLSSVIKELAFRKIAEIEKLVNDFKADRSVLESMTISELTSKSKKEDLVLIDVRPQSEYSAGHIPGAISIPFDEVADRENELPKDKTIVAYCRGPLCVWAADVVKYLNEKNYKAVRMEDGYVEWKLQHQQDEHSHSSNNKK